MKIVGCDLHARQQSIAMVDTETGEFIERTLVHEGTAVRDFYGALEGRVVVGIEATGAMQWFLELLEESGIEYRVGHPAKIRAQETRKQKHDRRDAELLLKLLREDRFPDGHWTAAPSTINMRPFTAARRIGLIAAYAGESYQACACSEVSNAMTTTPLGGASPSRLSV